MGSSRNFWKSVVALAMLAASAQLVLAAEHSVPAANLTITDLTGKWCSDVVNYTFSTTRLDVQLHTGQTAKHGNFQQIFKVDGSPEQIDIYWVPYSKDNFTRFTFESGALIQVQQTEGDKGPRRVFHRC
jgi:hypothetical protein